MPESITSMTNPRVKHLARLRDRRTRDREGTFLIEGYRHVSRAMAAGITLTELYTCPDLFLGENEPALIAQAETRGAQHLQLAEAPFRKVSYRDRPEGLLAVAEQFDTSLDSLTLGPESLVRVVEAIEKPGNLGTMLRTADAAGVTAVVAADPTTDPFNPNVVRASTGSLFTVPLAVAGTEETLARLDDEDVRILATTPDATTPHWDADYRGAVAIVVGSEQCGLTEPWLEGAAQRLRIPMAGMADSLNAAMAAGVVLFEAVRQRAALSGSGRTEY